MLRTVRFPHARREVDRVGIERHVAAFGALRVEALAHQRRGLLLVGAALAAIVGGRLLRIVGRAEEEGAIHHVYARGNGKQVIFVDARDRRTYLGMLGSVVRRCRWYCLAFCLMDNHVHLLIETPFANLGDGMMRLHSPYAQLFNERHDKVGHLFQGRYGARRVRDSLPTWEDAARKFAGVLAHVVANGRVYL